MTKYAFSLLVLAGLSLSACKDKTDDPPPVSDVVELQAPINGRRSIQTGFPNGTPSLATGLFTGTYTRSTKVLTYTVTYSGMTPVAGHLHAGTPGQVGGVEVSFTNVTTSPITGTATLTDDQANKLLAGGMYANLHSAAYGNGEIRGDVKVKDANETFLTARIDAAQQVPTNSSTATGTFAGTYNSSTKVLTYSVFYTGLTPVAGHIHAGAPGVAGGVEVTFANVGTSPITGTATLTADQATKLLANGLYVNLHTAAFGNGEIRGDIKQLTATPVSVPVALRAPINGSQSIQSGFPNGTPSLATGLFTGSYEPTTKVLTYNVAYTGFTPTMGHIHAGAPGVAGGVEIPFSNVGTSPITGTATLTADQATKLLGQGMYVNLHSATYGNGEIRGDIKQLDVNEVYLTTRIDAAQQTPTNSSTATGTFAGTYNSTTKVLTYKVFYTGLTPTMGHIHAGAPGVAGGVEISFANVGTSPITGTATLTDDQATKLLNNGLYVNLHTAAFGNGEIRGDIKKVQ